MLLDAAKLYGTTGKLAARRSTTTTQSIYSCCCRRQDRMNGINGNNFAHKVHISKRLIIHHFASASGRSLGWQRHHTFHMEGLHFLSCERLYLASRYNSSRNSSCTELYGFFPQYFCYYCFPVNSCFSLINVGVPTIIFLFFFFLSLTSRQFSHRIGSYASFVCKDSRIRHDTQ